MAFCQKFRSLIVFAAQMQGANRSFSAQVPWPQTQLTTHLYPENELEAGEWRHSHVEGERVLLTILTNGEHVSQVGPIKVVPVTFAEATRKESCLPRLAGRQLQVAGGLLCLCETETQHEEGPSEEMARVGCHLTSAGYLNPLVHEASAVLSFLVIPAKVPPTPKFKPLWVGFLALVT